MPSFFVLFFSFRFFCFLLLHSSAFFHLFMTYHFSFLLLFCLFCLHFPRPDRVVTFGSLLGRAPPLDVSASSSHYRASLHSFSACFPANRGRFTPTPVLLLIPLLTCTRLPSLTLALCYPGGLFPPVGPAVTGFQASCYSVCVLCRFLIIQAKRVATSHPYEWLQNPDNFKINEAHF